MTPDEREEILRAVMEHEPCFKGIHDELSQTKPKEGEVVLCRLTPHAQDLILSAIEYLMVDAVEADAKRTEKSKRASRN